MFTRVVECTIKPGKTQDFFESFEQEVLPILQKQSGFTDETVLVSQNNQNEVLAISFWRTPEDAERYHDETYPEVAGILRPVLATDPRVRTYTVKHSLTHKIGAAKAA
jgi:heme-degrading monooxygenase HmoA